MRVENADIQIIKEYFYKMENAQRICDEHDLNFTFPIIPENINEETKLVLKAYQNMAKVWNSAGGCAPDPCKYIELLYIMGCNKLSFNNKRKK